MDLTHLLRRHVHPEYQDFDPDKHWPIRGSRTRVWFRYKGIRAHPLRHLMNEDLRNRGLPLLERHHHRILHNKELCDYPICINPRHYQVVANRKLLGIMPQGTRVYYPTERYPIPIFSWQDEKPAPVEEQPQYSEQEIIDDLEYHLYKIDFWKQKPAEELLAQLGDPAFTVEMIRSLQQR